MQSIHFGAVYRIEPGVRSAGEEPQAWARQRQQAEQLVEKKIQSGLAAGRVDYLDWVVSSAGETPSTERQHQYVVTNEDDNALSLTILQQTLTSALGQCIDAFFGPGPVEESIKQALRQNRQELAELAVNAIPVDPEA